VSGRRKEAPVPDQGAAATPDTSARAAAEAPARATDGGPWYAEGLRFECTACGKCCRNHGDGFEYVYSTRRERAAIAKHLGLSLRAFERRYCERVAGSLSFRSEGDACIFLQDGRCSIYPFRPRQCSTFPFWPELLESEDVWQRDVASFCPGVGQGPRHDLNAIRTMRSQAGP
jgi:Fe-S-cluster containining protein